jgi:cell division protein FtsB
MRTGATRSTAFRGRRSPEAVESRGSMPRRKRPPRSTLALRWLGVAGLVAIALAYVHPLRSYEAARGRVAERRTELAALERTNAGLERRLAESGEDAFVEREARRLGLVRPGEHLYIVKGVKEWRKPSIP